VNVLYFFTYDYSLKTWKDSGNLDRELYYFQKHYEKFKTKHILITYGGKEDSDLLQNIKYIEVIPIYTFVKYSNNKFIRFIKSFYIPFVLNKLVKNIDILKQNQLNGSWVPILFKLITKKPLYIRTGYDMYEFSILENKSFILKRFFRTLTKVAIKFSDLYSVTSRSDKSFLENNFKIEQNKLIIRPNWIILRELNVKKEFNNTLISIGRLEKQKNYMNLLKRLCGSEIDLHIYGNGSEKSNLIDFSKNNNIKLIIHNVVPNDKIQSILLKHSIFISNSIYEGNPKSVLEAMALGCVVVVSNIKNHSEIIENGKTGILFEKDDNLEKIIKDLFSNKSKIEYLAKNAQEYVKSNNSIEILLLKENNDMKSLLG
tara:strand:- start:2849 stop:3964 length:1116 start_codon:yes stop_codon:yes gene_type:complete